MTGNITPRVMMLGPDSHQTASTLHGRKPVMLRINWGGHQLELHEARAVFWRKARTLIVADTHFGKAAAFRHHGVPVPSGTTLADTQRLGVLIAATRAERLIVLGDFLHARAGRAPATMTTLEAWRRQHRSLPITLVRGNHDRNAGDPPCDWDITCVDEPFLDGPFSFWHAGKEVAVRGLGAQRRAISAEPFHFAGHIHPCAVLHDRYGASMRAACFWFTARVAVLPAFGSFTGMHPIRAAVRDGVADRVFAVGSHEVVEIAGERRARSSRTR